MCFGTGTALRLALFAALILLAAACEGTSTLTPTPTAAPVLVGTPTPPLVLSPTHLPYTGHLEEEVPPCTRIEGSSADPCEPDVKVETSLSGGASSDYLFDYDQPLTIRDFLDGSSLGSIPHLVLRGTYIPDTARCTSGTPYRPGSHVEPGYTQHSILIKCYTDVRVNGYVLGSGPARLTALVDFRHYWDGYYAGNAADLGMTEQQLIELFVEAHLSILEHGYEYTGGIYGREVILFIGPAHDQATEVWEVFRTWDVQQRMDGTTIAVHPHRDDWRRARPDDYQTHRSLLEMELPAFTQAATAAHQARVTEYGERIAPESIQGRAAGVDLPMLVTDASQLTRFYRSTGAYDDRPIHPRSHRPRS